MPNTKQEAIGHMFNQIAPTYDSVNRILSFRQDVRWRRVLAREAQGQPVSSILDVATGTGDLLITLVQSCPSVEKAVGVDIAENMLAVGEKKIKGLGLEHFIYLQKADATKLPFGDSSFDLITIAFGIRNVVEIESALNEMLRVLRPNGRLLILEFSLPKNWLFKIIYLCYFRYVLPFIGGLIAKNVAAYRYLNQTVEAFFSVSSFSDLLTKRGFSSVTSKSLSFGIATMYSARKN